MRERIFLTLLATLFVATAVPAHTWLTQDTVDNMLDRITAAVERLTENDVDTDALFELADASSSLAVLMNEEFASHGAEQRELLLSSIARAEEAGVNILWSGSHSKFFYDGEAYQQFIELAEPGDKDAEARFYLIETDFYLGDAEEKSALLDRIDQKTEFLDVYPNFRERARILLFLGIDHRDLWRLCKEANDNACVSAHEKLATERFETVRDENPDEEIGEVGERLLGRFDEEKTASKD